MCTPSATCTHMHTPQPHTHLYTPPHPHTCAHMCTPHNRTHTCTHVHVYTPIPHYTDMHIPTPCTAPRTGAHNPHRSTRCPPTAPPGRPLPQCPWLSLAWVRCSPGDGKGELLGSCLWLWSGRILKGGIFCLLDRWGGASLFRLSRGFQRKEWV